MTVWLSLLSHTTYKKVINKSNLFNVKNTYQETTLKKRQKTQEDFCSEKRIYRIVVPVSVCQKHVFYLFLNCSISLYGAMFSENNPPISMTINTFPIPFYGCLHTRVPLAAQELDTILNNFDLLMFQSFKSGEEH